MIGSDATGWWTLIPGSGRSKCHYFAGSVSLCGRHSERKKYIRWHWSVVESAVMCAACRDIYYRLRYDERERVKDLPTDTRSY